MGSDKLLPVHKDARPCHAIHHATHQPPSINPRLHQPTHLNPPPLQLVRSLTVCRVLIVPRAAYSSIASDFTQSARTVLENLQRQAEQLVQQEFRGGMASRLLRSSMAAAGAYGGLAYQHTSAETGGQASTTGRPPAPPAPAGGAEGAGGEGAAAAGEGPAPAPAPKGIGLSLRQQQVVGTLQRVRALVRHYVAGVSRRGRLQLRAWMLLG
jgi:hypothetical protein